MSTDERTNEIIRETLLRSILDSLIKTHGITQKEAGFRLAFFVSLERDRLNKEAESKTESKTESESESE